MRCSRADSAITNGRMVSCYPRVADRMDRVFVLARARNDEFNAGIGLRQRLVNHLQDLRGQHLMPAIVALKVESARFKFSLCDIVNPH